MLLQRRFRRACIEFARRLGSTATGNSLPGSMTLNANRPSITSSKSSPQKPARQPSSSSEGWHARSRPSTYQRTRSFRSATLATIEPAIWFWAQHWARAAESKLVTVESPGGSSCLMRELRKLVLGHGPCLVENRQDFLAAIQEGRAIEVAEGFELATIPRLPLGDCHQEIVAQVSDAAAGSAAWPRLRANRRAGAPSRGSAGRDDSGPGSRRQRSSAARRATEWTSSSNSSSAHSVRPSCAKPSREMVGQIEQVADVVKRVLELRRVTAADDASRCVSRFPRGSCRTLERPD